MNMSHRLTFSILSIFLLMAFVTVPVWAHSVRNPADQTPNDDTDTGSYIADHLKVSTANAHPVVQSITLGGLAADGYIGAGQNFPITITFVAGTVPTDLATTNITGLGSNWIVSNLQKSGNSWTANISTTGTSDADGSNQTIIASGNATVSGAATPTAIYTPINAVDSDGNEISGFAADKANRAKGTVVFDTVAPIVDSTAITVKQVPEGGGRPLPVAPDVALSRDLVITFTIAEGTGYTGIDFTNLSSGDAFEATFTPTGATQPEDKVALMLEFVEFGLAADDTDNTKYAVTVKQNKGAAAIMEKDGVVISFTVTDKAGNTSDKASTSALKLAARAALPQPATIPTPALGNTTAGGTLTVTFSKDPGEVTAAGYTITGTGTKRTIAVPAGKTAGDHEITLSWGLGGTGKVTYTIPAETDPAKPANGFNFQVPANSFVILVRDKTAAIGNTPPMGQDFASLEDIDGNRVIPDSKIIEWDKMPDLAQLFNRNAAGGGGALVLRKQVGDNSAPAVGTVGISEIMWAIDASMTDDAASRKSQWIEIHNLNATAEKVRIYAQTGAQFTNSDKVVVNTQAGDQIHDTPSSMVVDVVTNYFGKDNVGNRGQDGWEVPGQNGSSRTGINFVSMERKGTFKLPNGYKGKAGSAKDAELDGRHPRAWEDANTVYDTEATTAGAAADLPETFEFLGTPGRVNTFTASTHILTAGRTNASNSVIISEVANRDDLNKAYEWIELRNETAGEINLNNYQISLVTSNSKDEPFIYLPNNHNAKLAPKGQYGDILLLLASDPRDNADHPIAVGYDVARPAEEQAYGIGDTPARYLVVEFGKTGTMGANGLPDGDGQKFVLIVRSADNHEGNHGHGDKGRAELGNADHNRITDIAGYDDNLAKNPYPNAVSKTSLWPMYNYPAPASDKNRFFVNQVRRRQHVDGKPSGVGTTHGDKKDGQVAYGKAGYTGIGYKRQAARSDMHGGTPGYHDNINKNKVSELADGATVVISEMMLTQGNDRRKLPQWIELYNTSSTQSVNLGAGWKLEIDTGGRDIQVIDFGAKGTVKTILPNQTVLVVSGTARSAGSDFGLPSSTVFPTTRVFNVHRELRNDDNAGFKGMGSTDPIINIGVDDAGEPYGFNIQVVDGSGSVSDEVGNLSASRRASPDANWAYPTDLTEEGYRSSLIRIFDEGEPRDGLNLTASNIKPLGGTDGEGVTEGDGIDMKYSWVHAIDTDSITIFERHTWYGSEDDWGSPANRAGQVLAVSLSSFRPTLENGEVVIRWTTASELDNAGFNILRSESRDGEYKQVNAELIQGKGTTGERSTYKWTDATAKPGVVYYYQIEDVSFAGERTALAMTKLKGLISAKNKLTTQWGELKNLR